TVSPIEEPGLGQEGREPHGSEAHPATANRLAPRQEAVLPSPSRAGLDHGQRASRSNAASPRSKRNSRSPIPNSRSHIVVTSSLESGMRDLESSEICTLRGDVPERKSIESISQRMRTHWKAAAPAHTLPRPSRAVGPRAA